MISQKKGQTSKVNPIYNHVIKNTTIVQNWI